MRKLIYCIFSITLLTACAETFEIRTDIMRDKFDNGDFSTDTTAPQSQDTLSLLINGISEFHAGNYDSSDTLFEEFNHRNIPTVGTDITREASSIIAGPMSMSYRPYMMDTLFVSYYQILDAIAAGRWNDARVIINQSYARQQDMSREYKQLLESTQRAYKNHAQTIDQLNENTSQWAAYSDIMNPALMYLGGIYFLSDGDWQNATTYLTRASGMTGAAKPITTDLKMAEQRRMPTNTTWVFIETGFAPRLVQERITLPYVTSNGLSLLTIASANPVFDNSYIRISGATQIADIDKMFMTEYRQYHINDVLRALATTASRVVLQSVANHYDSKNDSFWGLAAAIYSITTTSADVRTWPLLPKRIYVMRVATPKSGLIEITSGGNVITTIDVPRSGNYIAYVRVMNQTSVNIMQLK